LALDRTRLKYNWAWAVLFYLTELTDSIAMKSMLALNKWSKCHRYFSSNDGASLLKASRASLGLNGNPTKEFTKKSPQLGNPTRPLTVEPVVKTPQVTTEFVRPRVQGHINEFSPRFCVVGVGGAGGNAGVSFSRLYMW
jgi:hypothetical protein